MLKLYNLEMNYLLTYENLVQIYSMLLRNN